MFTNNYDIKMWVVINLERKHGNLSWETASGWTSFIDGFSRDRG